MDTPAAFSSLPPELVAKICSHSNLDKEGLIALRLTSKVQGIHASATKTFAKRYFTDVQLLYNKYSLETFVKICQHPVFAPSILRVQLSCAHFDIESLVETVDDLRLEGFCDRDLSEKVERLYNRCDAESYDPLHASALLERAFFHLAQSDHSFVLAVSTDEDKSLGHSKTWEADMNSGEWRANPSLALRLLLDAAHSSGCRVRGIEVTAFSEFDHDRHSSVFDYPELGSSLSELTFELWVHMPQLDYDLGMMQNLLSLAVHLKVLHIEANIFTRDDDAIVPLAQSISSLPLEELHLTCLYMRQDIVTGILKSLGPTLCRLKMARCKIPFPGTWKQILLSIQQHAPQLRNLHLEDTGRIWLPDTVEYEGIANIRMGVAGLLQTREDMARDSGIQNDVDNW